MTTDRAPAHDASRGTAALVLVVLATALCAAAGPELLPVDEAAKRPDFFSFRAQLQRTVARRDTAALLAVVHPRIKNGFGGDDGIDEFRTMWRIEAADSTIWDSLGTVLALGGSFNGDDWFIAPYVSSRWPRDLDGFEHVAVTGSNVRIRAQPDTDATTLTTASFVILPLARAGAEREGWTAVRLEGARVGYIAEQYVRSPIDYRAYFQFEDMRWRLVMFLAGD